MATIAENLQRLISAAAAIKNAIIAKGGTVAEGDGLEDFAEIIANIPISTISEGTFESSSLSIDADNTRVYGMDNMIFGCISGYQTKASKYLGAIRGLNFPADASAILSIGVGAYAKYTGGEVDYIDGIKFNFSTGGLSIVTNNTPKTVTTTMVGFIIIYDKSTSES